MVRGTRGKVSLAAVVFIACSRAAVPQGSAPPLSPAAPESLAWFENDYAGALAVARSKKVPLFVDASAVWCHTCLSMRTFVLDDPALDRSGFAWLSFDVELPANAAVAARYPAKVLPTFFIVDPANESVQGRWEGAATVEQLRAFLRDGKRSIELSHAGSLAPDDPLALLLAGHRAAMAEDHDGAARAFEAALRAGGPSWPRRSDALLALIAVLERGKRVDACLELALSTLSKNDLSRTSTLADFCSSALDCAAASTAPDQAKALRELVQKVLLDLARDPLARLSADDRGDALRMVWEAREALGDHAGALEAARLRLEVLDDAVRVAPTPAVASTFDGARMETLVFLGRARDAVRFLSERERELPDDYNPPHRLAQAYDALGDQASALDAIDRAIAKAWGARKARMLGKRAGILQKLGRTADARASVEAELELLRGLPAGQKKPELEAATEKRLETLR